MSSSIAPLALTLACAVACGASPHTPRTPRTPWRPFASGATAREAAALPQATKAPPAVALVLPGASRWGNLAGWFAVRSWGLWQGDRVLLSSGGFHYLPASEPALAMVPADEPAVVRVRIDPASPYQWFNAVVSVERLDGTAEAPLDLAATLDDARRRWNAYREAEGPALTAALDRAGADTPGQPLGPESATDVDVFLPSWQAGELVVVAAGHLARSSELRVHGHWGCDKYRTQPDRDLGESQPPCAPREIGGTVTSRRYAAHLALVLVYDARGTLIDERRFAADAVAGPAPIAVGL